MQIHECVRLEYELDKIKDLDEIVIAADQIWSRLHAVMP